MAVPRAERVVEHQQLCLRVDRGALPGDGDPRPTDLDPTVRLGAIGKARTPYNPSSRTFDRKIPTPRAVGGPSLAVRVRARGARASARLFHVARPRAPRPPDWGCGSHRR